MDYKTASLLLSPILDEIREIGDNQHEIITMLSSIEQALLTACSGSVTSRASHGSVVELCQSLMTLIQTHILPNQSQLQNETKQLSSVLESINFAVNSDSPIVS